MSRLLRIAFLGARSLSLHPLRSFLTALGIIIGVGTVIYMLAIIEGQGHEIQEKIRARGATNIILRSLKPSEDGNNASRNRKVVYGLTYEDAKRIRTKMPQVDVVVPVRHVNGDIHHADKRVDTVAFATVPWYLEVSKGQLARGRWFTDTEVRTSSPVAILGRNLARTLFEYRDPLHQMIRLGSKVYRVVGILKPTITNDEADATIRDRAAYIPLSTVRERFGETNVKRSSGSVELEEVDLHQILVRAKKMKAVEGTAEALETMLKRFHKNRDYEIDVPLSLLREAQKAQEDSERLFGSIAAISLLVGGIGIMNIMLATVTERTREIGVRRALGARRWDITSQFLVETTLLSVLGGLIGIGGGLLFAKYHTTWFNPQDPEPIVDPRSVLLAFGISAAIGILAGLYPAVRAAMMDPIKALRHE